MQGLELSRLFYEQCLKPIFMSELPELLDRVAVGLVGEGSECFGWDDEFSQDHDWGASCCLWLPREEWKRWTEPVECVLSSLPKTFSNATVMMSPRLRMGRRGPMAIEDFYKQFTNLEHIPQSWREWRSIPETFLSVCTNGDVFSDPLGTFTHFRNALKEGYPRDVRLKKIAARCATMAQSGQYNLPRCLKRKEYGGALLCVARFSEATLSLVHLLNNRYMPFYKWAHRSAKDLPLLGKKTADCISSLSRIDWMEQGASIKAELVIEPLAASFASALCDMDLADDDDSWLLNRGTEVQSRITTPELRSMHIMLE